uniref:Uncharacterized protein n=1 Tax=viral metagenome TaxID=1070528 RepID=A0A6C0JPP5_9ZZZZ
MSDSVELKIPIDLTILEAGVAGVRYEIFPYLLEEVKTQKELDDFGMDVIGDRYMMPICESVM